MGGEFFQANEKVVERLAVLLLALLELDARESDVSLTPEMGADCIEKLIHCRRVCNGNRIGQRGAHLRGEASAEKGLLSFLREAGSIRELEETLPRRSPCAKFAQRNAWLQFSWGLGCGAREWSCS